VRLKVAMNDVPSTPSFRGQQLAAMSEAFKSMPQEFQVVALPHLLQLMDVPTVLTLASLPLTLADATTGAGVKIYDFPEGRILILGATGSIAMTTTSVLASTLNAGVTCNWGVGSTTQANGTLATTEQDILQKSNITASATVNVAGAASNAFGALAAFDGTATALDAYLNVGVATGTDIDGDATVTISGTVTLHWMLLGDY
jgi:hypothetical protein